MPTTQKDKTKDVYIYGSLDEDDICPICLEEYTLESPRTLTDCNHHYHLHCIYQWMEKSQVCPFCCKLLLVLTC
ncbi:hypothetical protein K2173_015175 [Erythroxylum novogranatense]|uniref:RING-type E3 ubiquitin transferase n=1 Tax=Erythroxylum novogranatense TaxID=1862640 RepID=A0AAV8T2R9_9ROSI|nr:hypothetical protein K2173_015175 [Erythroxylum novogranatense]